ncbi:MAG: hypothetical protein PWQ32_1547 [Thermococcaceae archaeon]|nr:hypothetical protein [Thermococcaceae archaeon]
MRVVKIQTKGDVRVSYIIETVTVKDWTGVVAEIVLEKENAPEWEISMISRMPSGYVGAFGGELEIRDVFVDRKVGSYVIKAKYEGLYESKVPIEAIENDIVEKMLSLRFEAFEDYNVNMGDPFEDFDPSEYWEFVDWEE